MRLCEFSTHNRRDLTRQSRIGVGGVYWAQYECGSKCCYGIFCMVGVNLLLFGMLSTVCVMMYCLRWLMPLEVHVRCKGHFQCAETIFIA